MSEKRKRIRCALFAYAYELGEPLVPDAEFDALATSIDPSVSTGDEKLDAFFRTEFQPYTGSWVHAHPELWKLSDLYERLTMARVTPEGKIKKMVRAVLDEFGAYYFMPVQTGFGAAGLDFHCGIEWRGMMIFFCVETKAEAGDTVTDRQANLIRSLRAKKAKVFIIGSEVGVAQLREWLENVRSSSRK